MITDEQAKAAAKVWRSKPTIATKYDQAADALEKWTRQELSRRTPPDDGPITAEEADRAYDEAESVPISDEEVEALLQHVRDRSDGPITAEWCREHGGELRDETDCHGETVPRCLWNIGRVSVVVELWSDGVVIAKVCRTTWKENPTRSQLLALIAALRGEPSENPGQFEPLSPAEQLPNVSCQQVWIVGMVFTDVHDPAPEGVLRWTFQGVFLDRKQAEAACRNHFYFVAPATIGESLPHEPAEWPGAEFVDPPHSRGQLNGI